MESCEKMDIYDYLLSKGYLASYYMHILINKKSYTEIYFTYFLLLSIKSNTNKNKANCINIETDSRKRKECTIVTVCYSQRLMSFQNFKEETDRLFARYPFLSNIKPMELEVQTRAKRKVIK